MKADHLCTVKLHPPSIHPSFHPPSCGSARPHASSDDSATRVWLMVPVLWHMRWGPDGLWITLASLHTCGCTGGARSGVTKFRRTADALARVGKGRKSAGLEPWRGRRRESGRNTVALLFFKITWDRRSVGAADWNNNTISVFLAREQGRPRCTAGFDGGKRK